MSAALVASLLTFIAASSVSASVAVVSAGNVPVNGTSANAATFTFTEQAAASLANASGSFTVTIAPAAPGAGSVTFSGTPSVTGSTGSLGASASVAGSVLTISIAGSDIANVESIIISGLKIHAAAGTTLGAISATMGGFTGSVTGADRFAGGGTATGTLSVGYGAGATSVVVNVTSAGCNFSTTAVSGNPLSFATSAETKNITAAGALTLGQQTLTIVATSNVHNAGEVVSETTGCAASTSLASPGTVVAALTYSSAGNATVFPGENNSPADNLTLVEPSAGFLAGSSTFTYTIATAGVVFSTAPAVADSDATMVLSAPVISADRKSATVTVTTASAAAATITLSGILYDVSATVPAGTFIAVGVATSAALAVLPASNTNAVVFRGIAASAPSPTVYIGENNQTAGVITFTESQAGFFTAGVGTGTNVFSICPRGVNFSFTLAPVAMVVGGTAAGNIILRDGAAASTTNIVTGIQNGACYTWYVWTASTTASTIKIGAAPSAATGPLINVSVAQAPGGVDVNLNVGSSSVDTALFATVQFATAVYRNQVSVTALSAPSIRPGSLHAAAGNVQIAETALGQLKALETICFEVLPRTFANQDTFLNSLNTADLPVATASGTGLVIGPVNASESNCSGVDDTTIPNAYMQSFTFQVLQQSTAGDGKVVISGINYTTLADAVEGPVQMSVYGFGGGPTVVIFHSTVSNAKIAASGLAGAAATRLGVTQTGAFSTSTKVQKVGKYVTFRFDFGVANAGAHVDIWGASKSGNDWTAFSKKTGRVANASGVVYYYVRSSAASWWSFRATVSGSGTLTPARQARWIS
jgi:hypothetical protein